MRVIALSLFVAFAIAAPAPDANGDPVELIVNGVPEGHPLEISDIVDVKLHKTNNGQTVSASDLLYPLTAQGIAEVAAAAAVEAPSAVNVVDEVPSAVNVVEEAPLTVNVADGSHFNPSAVPSPALPDIHPQPIVLPSPALPEVHPEPIVLPAPALPEVQPEPIVLPAPALPEVHPEPIVLPAPALPEVHPEPIALPAPALPEVHPEVPAPAPAPAAAQPPQGEIYNDGIVSVTINTAHAALTSTMQYLNSWYNLVINYFSNGTPVKQQVL